MLLTLKKNVLIIQRDLGGGGAEKVLIDILNNFDYSRYNVTLLLIYKIGVYVQQINKNVNVQFVYDPKKYKSKIMQSIYCRFKTYLYDKHPKLLYKWFVDKNYDIEIAFLEGETTAFLYNSSNINSKKIAWVHTDISKYTEIRLNKEKIYYEKIDHIICVSKEAKKNFDKMYPKYIEKSSVIYNLIDCKLIKKHSNKPVSITSNVPLIIGVGRLSEGKRFDVLIKSHKLLIDDGVNHKLIILGTGSKESELKHLIKELNVENSVELLGFKKNPYPYIKLADVFVMSSDFEGFSLVTCEALVLGKAIVSTKCTGPIELLEDGKYGQLVECDNPMQLKEAIKRILINDKLKRDYEMKSVERSKMFNSKKTIEEIYTILDK